MSTTENHSALAQVSTLANQSQSVALYTKKTHPFWADVPTAFTSLAIQRGGIADVHTPNQFHFEHRADADGIRIAVRKAAMGLD